MSSSRIEHEQTDVSKLRDGDLFRMLFQGATVALLVAQLLLPADGTTATDGAGIPLVMLWLLLFALWLVGGVWRFRTGIRMGVVDLALLLLILWHTLSGLWALGLTTRESVNMTWQWIAAGCCFLLIRQLFTSHRECRTLLVILIAVGVGLAGYSYYQSTVEIPATQQTYQKNPAAEIKAAFRIDPDTDISPLLQELFEERLAARRPTATFILSNSFAGFLTPWLVLCAGISFHAFARGRIKVALFALSGAVCIAGSLLATHSRTAVLAVLCGLVLLALWKIMPQEKPSGRRIVSGIGAVLGLVGTTTMLLIINPSWFQAARRSVIFRIEYWQATAAMIAEAPWLGWGPGNFRDRYTAYKLPASLEEVADPHNMILEVWATAGTPAMLALVAVIAFFFVETLARPLPQRSLADNPPEAGSTLAHLPLGALAGLLLALLVGLLCDAVTGPPPADLVLLLVAIALGCMYWGMQTWIAEGPVTRTLVAAATAALLLNLCTSGGLGNPGVSANLWVLLAVGLNLVPQAKPSWVPPRSLTVTTIVLTVALAIGCQWTAYRPVLDAAVALRRARVAEQQMEPKAQLASLRQASQADGLSAGPAAAWARLLFRQLQLQLLRNNPDQVSIQRRLADDFDRAIDAWRERVPYSAAACKESGDMYLQLYRLSGQSVWLDAAIAAYEQAVSRYPSSSSVRAHLAWAESLSGKSDRAAAIARRALELDDLHEHPRIKLESQLQQLADPRAGGENTRTQMERLRENRLN